MGWSCNFNEKKKKGILTRILVGKLHGVLLFLTSRDIVELNIKILLREIGYVSMISIQFTRFHLCSL
jgi:hypothetical protein